MELVRNKSVLTGGEVEELSSIEKFPIFIGASEENQSADIFSDLTFDICKQTGIIQLRNLVDPNLVYSKFHSEAIGNVWETHHDLLAELIGEYAQNRKILEIGGSNSRLAQKTLNINSTIKEWTIIEPNLKNKVEHDKIHYIENFFPNEISDNLEHSMIVHSHVFEHMLNPAEFLYTVSSKQNYGDLHIFSVPNLYQYLKNKFVNTINFEHTIFLTEEIIDYLLSIEEYRILEKIRYGEHSIFYVTIKAKCEPKALPNKYKEYKKLYLTFINYYKTFVDKLNKKLNTTDKYVYLFGGHIFSQYLIALGLDTTRIICILDNSKLKNGKRLYGTDLIIKSPNEVNLTDSLIILKVGQYQNEIKEQLLHINKKIEFYE